ncbi:MAG: response regulator [Phormidesmis sp.]
MTLQPLYNLALSNATILIVDDSPDNLRVLSATLTAASYDIRCAKNGSMALKAIALADLPDLILLDIQMPDVDGYEVCRRLKEDVRSQHIPVIFISALDDTLDKVKAFSAGGVDYITKPFQVEEVLARVRNQLSIQAAQVQLAQAEKMASLGQLVAGIAHEINNPVSFIQGNITCLEGYAQDLLRLVATYQQQYPKPTAAVESVAHDIDLDYLQADLPKVLQSMTVGTDRIANIIKSLRNFSRLDEANYKRADIHEGLEGTLLILESRLKASGRFAKIDLVKNYDELPLTFCWPGALNQVFMNMTANAIDAIDSKRLAMSEAELQQYQPQITISTAQAEQFIVIQIEDNGCGMTEAVKARLFNPFFTTKPAGIGTGLGLPSSRQIIHDQHQGQLICESQLGLGSQFTIRLPIIEEISS